MFPFIKVNEQAKLQESVGFETGYVETDPFQLQIKDETSAEHLKVNRFQDSDC